MPDQFVHGLLDDGQGGLVPGFRHFEDQWNQRSHVGLLRRRDPFDQVPGPGQAQHLQDRIPKLCGNAAAVLATGERMKGGHPDPIATSLVPQVKAPTPDPQSGAVGPPAQSDGSRACDQQDSRTGRERVVKGGLGVRTDGRQ